MGQHDVASTLKHGDRQWVSNPLLIELGLEPPPPSSSIGNGGADIAATSQSRVTISNVSKPLPMISLRNFGFFSPVLYLTLRWYRAHGVGL